VAIYKRGKIYWYKFMWNGTAVRESSKQGNDKVARNMRSAHRTALANGLVGIREKRPIVSLADFLKKDFIPYVESKHATKPGTLEYYRDGANMILKCEWSGDKIDQISDQHAQQLPRSSLDSLLHVSIVGFARFAALSTLPLNGAS
jgi:hypothetical protein